MDKEYAGITGVPEFTKAAAELAFGADNQILKDSLVGWHGFVSQADLVRVSMFWPTSDQY